ncbi:MAG: Denitrification system component NirT [Hyphomicrobiales bacterium]|nr:MAG: Denitrification system component NirT [Hyphomicrobiales bacterium]
MPPFLQNIKKWPVAVLVSLAFVCGGIGGVVFWGGFNTFMEYTNTLEFCIACHEMRQTVAQEYMTSPHYSYASGVRAICSDCHVPKEWVPKLRRKIQASNELYHWVVGTIDTPEKFEAMRFEMAKRVWAQMEANDSHECRNCHAYDSMHWEKQRRAASEKMKDAAEQKKTCIECHKGIAHQLPKEAKALDSSLGLDLDLLNGGGKPAGNTPK